MTNAEIEMSKISETKRANMEKEKETKRSNKENERLNRRKQRFDEAKGLTDVMGNAAKTASLLANDPTFYTKGNETIIKGVVPTNFENPFLGPIWFNYNGKPKIGQLFAWNSMKVPSQVVLSYLNTCGMSQGSAIDPINKMASMLYTAIQNNTNYSKPYQAADVALMIMAQRELVSHSNFIGKLFRISKLSSYQNPALPKEMFDAMGIDYDDFVDHASEYRKSLELTLVHASQLRIPNIALMKRAAQIAGGTYYDRKNNNSKSAIFNFRPAAYGRYAIIGSDTKIGAVTFTKISYPLRTSFTEPVTKIKVGELIQHLKQMVTALLQSPTDFKYISGDLGRVFDKFWDLRDLDLDSPQKIIYDDYTLQQIHNATVMYVNPDDLGHAPISFDFSTYVIGQSQLGNGLVACMPKFNITRPKGMDAFTTTTEEQQILINIDNELTVTTDVVIDATRLQFTYSQDPEDVFSVQSCGTEIIIDAHYSCYTARVRAGAAGASLIEYYWIDYPFGQYKYIAEEDSAVNAWASVCEDMAGRSVDHLPRTSTMKNYGTELNIEPAYNLNNFREFDLDTLEYMHTAAMFSLFGIVSEIPKALNSKFMRR